MKRVVVAVCAAVLLSSLAALNGASATPQARVAFTPTLTAWAACTGGSLQCSTLTVPLDYAHPDDGRTVRLAVTMAAADPSAGPYAGMMLTNPGGPGGSGTFMPVLQAFVPGDAAKRYDWIGFDPRGVGRSAPSLHCNAHYFGVNRPNFVPKTRRLMTFWLTKTSRYAARCGASTAKALLPYMTTRDTVRDMENLRLAYYAANPGKRPKLTKLNYYGYSYGTWLGQVYAYTYPTQVGRFVLDGVVDPSTYWYRSNLRQDVAFDRNLNIFFRWVARHRGVSHLGSDWRRIRRGFDAELVRLDRHPAASKRLGPDELGDAMLGAAYDARNWSSTASAYSRLIRTGRGAEMFRLYAESSMGDDNGYAVYNAVQCTDARRPTWATQKRDTWRIHENDPYMAWNNTWYNAPCLRWPAPSRSPVHPNGSSVTAKILLINETLDAATPYSGALTMRDRFPSASLIAGVGGITHAGSLSGVSCVDNRIAAYLDTGVVPTRQAGRRSDLNCPRIPPSGARTAARSTGASAGLPASIRELLWRAQRPSLG